MKKTRLYGYVYDFSVCYGSTVFFFNEKTLYRIMFRSIKQVFLALLSFSTSKASMINGSNSQHVYL